MARIAGIIIGLLGLFGIGAAISSGVGWPGYIPGVAFIAISAATWRGGLWSNDIAPASESGDPIGSFNDGDGV